MFLPFVITAGLDQSSTTIVNPTEIKPINRKNNSPRRVTHKMTHHALQDEHRKLGIGRHLRLKRRVSAHLQKRHPTEGGGGGMAARHKWRHQITNQSHPYLHIGERGTHERARKRKFHLLHCISLYCTLNTKIQNNDNRPRHEDKAQRTIHTRVTKKARRFSIAAHSRIASYLGHVLLHERQTRSF